MLCGLCRARPVVHHRMKKCCGNLEVIALQALGCMHTHAPQQVPMECNVDA